MTLTKTLAAAAAVTFIAGSAMAGGFGAIISEPTEVQIVEPSGSLPGWVIPALIVAALVAVASSGDDDDGDTAGGGGAGTALDN